MVGNKRLGMELCHVLPASTMKLLFVSLQDPRVTLLSSFSQTNLALLAKYNPQGFPKRAYSGTLSLSLLKTDVLIFSGLKVSGRTPVCLSLEFFHAGFLFSPGLIASEDRYSRTSPFSFCAGSGEQFINALKKILIKAN